MIIQRLQDQFSVREEQPECCFEQPQQVVGDGRVLAALLHLRNPTLLHLDGVITFDLEHFSSSIRSIHRNKILENRIRYRMRHRHNERV